MAGGLFARAAAVLVFLAAAAGAGLVAPGRAGHGLVGGGAALLGLTVGVFLALQAGLGGVEIDGTAALRQALEALREQRAEKGPEE